MEHIVGVMLKDVRGVGCGEGWRIGVREVRDKRFPQSLRAAP